MAVVGTFAVALVGEEAADIVHGTVPRAREVRRGELLVWNERYCRGRYLGGAELPAVWTRL